MPIPHLHILHPHESQLPGITQWLAEVDQLIQGEACWDGCRVRTSAHTLQASFDVPTQVDFVRREPGPVVIIQKVQASLRKRLEKLIARENSVYVVNAFCAEDVWAACEAARIAYESGEPQIPVREVIAYLIVKKLAVHDYWGGSSLNKAFLWADDLPNGGFPKEFSDRREVLDIAAALERFGVLTCKISNGVRKYALAEKSIIQPILDEKSFESHPRYSDLQAFFERKPARTSIRDLDYNQ